MTESVVSAAAEAAGAPGAESKDAYHVAVVGDAGVGKTSIVVALAMPVALDNVPAVVPPMALPQLNARDGLPGVCVAVDTPAPVTEEARQSVAAAIRAAQCVVVVVDALRPETLARVFDFWEPFIASARGPAEYMHTAGALGLPDAQRQRLAMERRRQATRVPVVIALNKVDLISTQDPQGAQMLAVLGRAVDSCRVETAFTCCAHARQSVADMFQGARKLIFFPITPLLTTAHRDTDFGSSVAISMDTMEEDDDDTERLTDGCRKALARVFHLLDKDNDGVLNDNEQETLARLMFAATDNKQARKQENKQSPEEKGEKEGDEEEEENPIEELRQMILDMHLQAGDVSIAPGGRVGEDQSTFSDNESYSREGDASQDDDLGGLTPIHTPLHGSMPGALGPGPRPTPLRQQATAAAAAAAVAVTPGPVAYVDVPEFSLSELESLVLAYAVEYPELFWKVLYHFGYDTSLKLTTALLSPEFARPYPGCRYELTQKAVDFLSERFCAHDVAKTGKLDENGLKLLFSTVPDGQPFPGEAPMTLHQFLEHCHMLCLVDTKIMLRTLACLGFEDDLSDAVEQHKGVLPSFHPLHQEAFVASLSEDIDSLPPRTVFHGFVFGSRGCGKTSILRGLAGKPFNPQQSHTATEQWACGMVRANEDDAKTTAHLVLTEFLNDDDDIVEDRDQMQRCDVCCFVFDTHNPNSFAHVLRLHELVMDRYPWLPCVHVAAKTDLTAVRQVAQTSPHAFLAAHSLPQPIALSMLDGTAAVPTAAAEATGSSAFAAMATPYVHGRSALLYIELVRAACAPSEHVDVKLATARSQPVALQQSQQPQQQQQQQQEQQQKKPLDVNKSSSSDTQVITTRSWRRTVAVGLGIAVSVSALAAAALFLTTKRGGRSLRPQQASYFLFAKHPFWRRT